MTEKTKAFRELEEYPRLVAEAVPNEKCLPCVLCEPVCPTGAIKVTFNRKREDFGPLREGIKGQIRVDTEKCNLCGRCARFCPAFLLLEKGEREKTPQDLKPYDQLLVDEELCDYCGLCAELCPEEAIEVEGKRLEEKLQLEGKIEVDPELCIGCGRCALVCPYQAIDVKKPFEGRIRMVEKNLPKCDPQGCQACFNVCPAKCWYVDEKGKAAPVEEQCILCGACELACPVSAIDVQRSEVRHTEVKETPWASEWKDAISALVTGEKKRPDVSRAIPAPEFEKPPLPEVKMPRIDPELLKLVNQALEPVVPILRKPKVRQILEHEPPEEAASKIVARMKKAQAEAKKAEEEGASVEKARPKRAKSSNAKADKSKESNAKVAKVKVSNANADKSNVSNAKAGKTKASNAKAAKTKAVRAEKEGE